MGVDRHADRALYLQLADILREEIASGRLQPGERLPSESELIDQHGVSRGTAREAIGTLRREGLVVVEHGRGGFVRSSEGEPLIRRVGGGRPFKSARVLFEEGVTETGQAVSIRRVPTGLDGPSPPEVGGPALSDTLPIHDTWLGFADGRPITLTKTWRTTVDEPMGDSAREQIGARMPTRNERRLLQLDEGAPIFEMTRVLRTAQIITEISVTLVVATRQSLLYELPS